MSSVRHTRVSREGCQERNDTPRKLFEFQGIGGRITGRGWTKRAGWLP